MIYHVKKIKTLKKIIKVLEENTILEVDSEWGADDALHSIQFGTDQNQYVLDCKKLHPNWKSIVQPLLISDHTLKLFHFVKSDALTFKKNGLLLKNTYCTHIAEKLIYSGQTKKKGFFSLGGLCKRYSGYEINDKKEDQQDIYLNGLKTYKNIRYAAYDVLHLKKIFAKQIIKLNSLNYINLSNIQDIDTLVGLENRVVHALVEMEFNGFKADLKRLAQADNQVLLEQKELVNKINTLAAKVLEVDKIDINWNSHKQKLAFLRLIKPDLENTQSDTLLLYRNTHEIFSLLVKYNKLSKLRSSFTNKFHRFADENDFIHYEINQLVSTGRMSISNPPMQQIPQRSEIGAFIRSCFVPEEGHKLITADWSNAELRLIADLSNEEDWIKTFEDGLNLHDVMCQKVFNIPLEDIKKPADFNPDTTYRDTIKRFNFSLAYGAGVYKIMEILSSTRKKAEAMLELYFSNARNVLKFLNATATQALEKRYTETPFYKRRRYYNRKRNITPKEANEIIREAKNHPIQGTNADQLKRALVVIYEDLKFKKVVILQGLKMILPLHDEFIGSAPEYKAEQVAEYIVNVMEKEATAITNRLFMKADSDIKDFWEK
tara:strand:- start:17 stop:1825 length:1809 start_codon:yes stop_codon:yes gene_type:complete